MTKNCFFGKVFFPVSTWNHSSDDDCSPSGPLEEAAFIMFVLLKIIPSQMEVVPLHCTVDITQKRRLFKNTKEIEKM